MHDTAFMDWLLSLICHHFFTVTVRPCRFAVINNGYHAWNAFVTFHEQILIIILHIIILVIKWERRVKLIFGHYLTCRRRMRSSPRSCRRPSTRPRICVRRSFWYVKLFYTLQIAIFPGMCWFDTASFRAESQWICISYFRTINRFKCSQMCGFCCPRDLVMGYPINLSRIVAILYFESSLHTLVVAISGKPQASFQVARNNLCLIPRYA